MSRAEQKPDERKPKKKRTFVRGLESSTYILDDPMMQRLSAPRVRGQEYRSPDHGYGVLGGNAHAKRGGTIIGPGDNPFLTQSLHLHFVEIPPNDSNEGHAHQNDASFYIIEGAGYEIHDGIRYDWEAGDVVLVHHDSVHRHFNPNDVPSYALVMKAKPTWMFLGLTSQGQHTLPENLEGFGPRQEWAQLWTPGAVGLKKVIKPADREWQNTPYGRLRQFTGAGTDARTFSVDIVELLLEPGGCSGRRWQMADEVLYAAEGAGYSLHWEVRAEFAEKYYAHIAFEPTRHEFVAGQVLYVPPNTVAQHFAAEGSPLRLISAQNRVFRNLGYDSTVFLDQD